MGVQQGYKVPDMFTLNQNGLHVDLNAQNAVWHLPVLHAGRGRNYLNMSILSTVHLIQFYPKT